MILASLAPASKTGPCQSLSFVLGVATSPASSALTDIVCVRPTQPKGYVESVENRLERMEKLLTRVRRLSCRSSSFVFTGADSAL